MTTSQEAKARIKVGSHWANKHTREVVYVVAVGDTEIDTRVLCSVDPRESIEKRALEDGWRLDQWLEHWRPVS